VKRLSTGIYELKDAPISSFVDMENNPFTSMEQFQSYFNTSTEPNLYTIWAVIEW
jgi:hemolysin-activating ACP:hemolysin acyltransferase